MLTIKDYMEMLSYRREAGSRGEKKFIKDFIWPVISERGGFYDAYGNLHLQVGLGPPTTLFSAHTDTVHLGAGTYQEVFEQKGSAHLAFDDFAGYNCLGADDASGCWILLNLILSKVEGYYVFHRKEELGGKGSAALAGAEFFNKNLFTLERAVAFDRRGFGDVITKMMVGKTCSDFFAEELSYQLGGQYAPCPRGTFTDTANYASLVGECTNISVGYLNEHGARETQHLGFLSSLLDILVKVDWKGLPMERSAGDFGRTAWNESTEWMDFFVDNNIREFLEGEKNAV